MIYSYGLEKFIYLDLLKYLPCNGIMNINDWDKLNNRVKPGDLVLFFQFSKSARKFQRILFEKEIAMFPNPTISFVIEDRINQLNELDKITQFPLNRSSYLTNYSVKINVPNLGTDKTVVKVGNSHCGENKYLVREGNSIYIKQNTLFEEFVNPSRSIRILMITDKPEDIFIVEHTNSNYVQQGTQWIKNIDPIETVCGFDKRHSTGISNIDFIINDAINIKKHLENHDYLGIDYVVGEEKTGLLEVNDMIGLPDDEIVQERAKIFFRNLVDAYGLVKKLTSNT